MNRNCRLVWNSALLSNFLLEKVSNYRKFFRGTKNSLEKRVCPELEGLNGVKTFREGRQREREREREKERVENKLQDY